MFVNCSSWSVIYRIHSLSTPERSMIKSQNRLNNVKGANFPKGRDVVRVHFRHKSVVGNILTTQTITLNYYGQNYQIIRTRKSSR